jgi:DNA-directed RNA polymerase specialized sigma24 family protein
MGKRADLMRGTRQNIWLWQHYDELLGAVRVAAGRTPYLEDDIYDATLNRALRHPPRTNGAPVSSWLKRLARSSAIDVRRRHHVRFVDYCGDLLPEVCSPWDEVSRADARCELRETLRILPELSMREQQEVQLAVGPGKRQYRRVRRRPNVVAFVWLAVLIFAFVVVWLCRDKPDRIGAQ